MMAILWVLIPLSFIMISIALVSFFWAVDQDQMEDLDHVSYQALDLIPEENHLRTLKKHV